MMRWMLIALLFASVAYGQGKITLDTPEVVDSPVATQLNWRKVIIEKGRLVVEYQLLDSTGAPIRNAGSFQSNHRYVCENVPTPGENAECLGAGNPTPCCTGAGTGTCDGFDDTCFSDIFGFQIRAQDVGTPIGVGLRSLLFNRFKADVLSPGNDGTFEP